MSTRIGRTLLLRTVRLAILAAAIVVPASLPALAQQSNRNFMEPPRDLPRVQGSMNLNRLFDALKVAPDNESAKYVENRIWACGSRPTATPRRF
jgi:hypothetical protein